MIRGYLRMLGKFPRTKAGEILNCPGCGTRGPRDLAYHHGVEQGGGFAPVALSLS